MTMPRGASPLLYVFILVFADDWNQLSAVAIAYFLLSRWWMWSHLSDCAGVPMSSDIEGLSTCTMDRAHQKGVNKALQESHNKSSLVTVIVYDRQILMHDIFHVIHTSKTWQHLTLHLIGHNYLLSIKVNISHVMRENIKQLMSVRLPPFYNQKHFRSWGTYCMFLFYSFITDWGSYKTQHVH